MKKTTLTTERLREAERTVQVEVSGPASISNLGPGFDALGLCIDGCGDVLRAEWSETPGMTIAHVSDARIPTQPEKNTAAVAAKQVLALAGETRGLRLEIEKGIPLGSGIGGSAASAVAGAWAANVLLGTPFTRAELVPAVLAGEAIASGSIHGDNVLPALFGGVVLVSSGTPMQYRQIPVPEDLPLAILLPEVEVLTSAARAILPVQVPFKDAVHNAASLAFLLEAFRNGQWEDVGYWIMQDRLVEPVRAQRVPCYEAVRQAALEAGAYGCALTGSGPAMFAVAEDAVACGTVLETMLHASGTAGISATGWVARINAEGVSTRSSKPLDA